MREDVLELNKKAWNNIGKKVSSPYIEQPKFKEMFEEFCSKLPQHAEVLDVGCGSGIPITKALADKGFRITGTDISEKMVAAAKENIPGGDFECKSMTEMEYKEEFDGAISNYSMLLLDPHNFKKAASRIIAALKKGGYFLLALNEPGPEGHNEEENYTKIMGQRMYSRPYTEREIKDIFCPSGTEIIRVERETVKSEKYGTEYCLMILMRKQS